MRRLFFSLFAFVAGILPAADADFHLYLLIGQSNMAGRGKIELQDKVAVPRVLMLNKANEWVELSGSFRNPTRKGLRIANKLATVDMLELPVPNPEAVQ